MASWLVESTFSSCMASFFVAFNIAQKYENIAENVKREILII
jgi:hypothetical protein